MKFSKLLLSLAIAVLTASTCMAEVGEDPFFNSPQKEAEYGFSAASQPHGIFYPGEAVAITLTVPSNPKATALRSEIEVISIHTRLQTPGEIGFYDNFGKSRVTPIPAIRVRVDLAAAKNGFLEVPLPLPQTFGTYALVLVRADGTRTMLGNVLRVLKPTPRIGAIPQIMSGKDWDVGVPSLQQRLGVTLLRTEIHWDGAGPGAEFGGGKADRDITGYAKYGIKVMVTTGIHPEWSRSSKRGGICDPKYDAEFGRWIEWLVTKYYTGGQTGLWGIENFNEPWEPNGISGWSSDSLRYRDLQKTLYNSAKKANKDVYILAASSIMNTEDKFLSEGDGSPMINYVDIFTDHYVQPKGAYGGRMAQKWKKLSGETETWGGGSEVLLHQFMFQFLATGNSFLSPVQFQHFATSYWKPEGQEGFYTANSVGLAIATWNALIQDRPFKGIAFPDHLPFLFQFGEDNDAQFVLAGRLMGLQTARARDVVWPQHAFAPDGSITIADPTREIELRDCAGNLAPRSADGSYTVQLSPTPWFVRAANASTVIKALRAGKMTGLRNVEILPGTLPLLPEAGTPALLPVRLHNLRNVPVSGTLTVATLTQQKPVTVDAPFQIATGATLVVQVPISVPADNGLPLRFTAKVNGINEIWDEVVPCTGVVHTAITGIEDPAWTKVPTVATMRAEGAAAGNEIDKIWKPFLFKDSKQEKLPAKRADLQLAWDDTGLSIRGSVETMGLATRPRLETRDDDSYFFGKEAPNAYRPDKDFLAELPFNGDSFQVGIDVDRVEERFQRLHDLPQLSWSLPDGFTAVPDTDYEFSAYLCRDSKPELWCLLAPGVPRYHYFPHHTRGAVGQGPVKDAAVEVKRISGRNVFFMHIPWTRLGFTTPPKAGQDFGFTCRWNGDGGVEFGGSYAATKSNGLTFHPYWNAPPSNSVRWTLRP